MANHESALKKSKQDMTRRMRNRAGKGRLKTGLKKFRALIEQGNTDAQQQFPALASLIDQSAKQGFIHQNAANRLKSRLSRQAAGLSA